MKRQVKDFTIEKLHKLRATIAFPEYQRQSRLWSLDKKQLLIDSILRDIDIPKLYFNKTESGEYEVVDGQQRLWAIWDFLDDDYEYGPKGLKFSELTEVEQSAISQYTLQIAVIEEAEDDYLRELFLRLQLGLLLVTGEKLHAAVGVMKEFVFDELAEHGFIQTIKIPQRRYAKETLAAQIAINSFTRKKVNAFARTRYEDLIFFFKEYERPQGADLELFDAQSEVIRSALDDLRSSFGKKASEFRNRSYVLSIYLVFEELRGELEGVADKKEFARFALELWRRLRAEMKAGFDRKNRELYVFETKLSSAPGERYQIEARHQLLVEYFEVFRDTGRIKGD